MNVKIIIVIVVVAMLAGGGVVYLVTGSENAPEPVAVNKPIKQEYKRIPNDDGERF